MQLERRIRDLEALAPQGEKLIGVPPLEFDYGTREAAFEAHGFDLEQIETPQAPVPCKPGVAMPLDYAGLRARMRREDALREKLKGRSHAEQKKIAYREGYYVIYPAPDWMPQPRLRDRRP